MPTIEDKHELNEIYRNHDVAAFKKFCSKHSFGSRALKDVATSSDDEAVSFLMHQAKAQLLYLGDECFKSQKIVAAKLKQKD
jgi:hypothetical protein